MRRKLPHQAAAARLAVPPAILARLRRLCLALPEAHEEPAWVGTRWSVRKKTFAHVLMIDAGWPPAYARAAASAGPACVLTFRSPQPQANASAYTWEPFFRPKWFPDIVGMKLGAGTDWEEVAVVVAESYRRQAPRKLAAWLDPAGNSSAA